VGVRRINGLDSSLSITYTHITSEISTWPHPTRHSPACFEGIVSLHLFLCLLDTYLHQIIKLPVNVATNGDRGVHPLDIGLVHQYFPCLLTQQFYLLFLQVLAASLI